MSIPILGNKGKIYRGICSLPLVTEFFFEEHAVEGMPLAANVPQQVGGGTFKPTRSGEVPVILPSRVEMVPTVISAAAKIVFPKLWLNDEAHSLMVGVVFINTPLCLQEVTAPEWWEGRVK